MHPPVLLWIDMKTRAFRCGMEAGLSPHFRIHECRDIHAIADAVQRFAPQVLCFDYDEPDAAGLAVLQETKLRFPSIPILMFSARPTVELTIWALRARVWDYFRKPANAGEVLRRLNILMQARNDACAQNARNLFLPQRMAPAPVAGAHASPALTAPALELMARSFSEKLPLRLAARVCGMGPYEFSRAFRREHGLTFRDYLIRLRIREAARLLKSSERSILEIAVSVGFNDPSHFARTFRRHFDATPSSYRLSHLRSNPDRNGSGPSADKRAFADRSIGTFTRVG